MENRNFMENNLRRLEQELSDHKRNLVSPGITDQKRLRLLVAVRDVEREILTTLRNLRDLTDLENSRMLRAIGALRRMKKK